MSTLPIEILRQIVEDIVDDVNRQIYYRHLLVISLSCRLLRHEAQRVLFRNPVHYTGSKGYKKAISFLDTISSSPNRLALYVKSFKIVSSMWESFLNSGELVKKLSGALRAMHNLKSFDFDDEYDRILALPSVLEGVHFKLTSFRWTGDLDEVSHSSSVKTKFLQHQDQIEHLALSTFIDESTFQPIAAGICLRLRSLSAPYSLTRLILPGKKRVTSLQWIIPLYESAGPEDFDINDSAHLDDISNELANLRYLSYGEGSTGNAVQWAPPLQHIAPYLKSLTCLEISGRNIKEVEALSQLPRLKTLVLTVGLNDNSPGEDEVTRVAVACKSLERIDVEEGGGGYFSSYRWDRAEKPFRIHTVDLDDSQKILWVNDFDMFDI